VAFRVKGLLAAYSAITVWALGLVLIKYLACYFQVFSQNFYRYSSAALTLLLLANSTGKGGGLFKRELLCRLLLPAFLVFLFQNAVVTGIYLTSTITAALILRLNVVLVNLFAYVLFREERRLIASKYYLLGFTLSLLGVVGVTLGGSSCEDYGFTIDMGASLVLLGTLFWALYLVSIKKLLAKNDPLSLSSIVFTESSILFFPLAMYSNGLKEIFYAPPEVIAILFFSGALSVGLGNWMNYIAIRELGVALPSTLGLLTPLLTAIFSYLLLGEMLTARQVIFGGLIILGCLLVLLRGD